MTKVKSSEIPHYELLYIISNKYSEDELKPIIAKVRQIIKNNGGNVTYSEEWGKKRLAYPIKLFRHGYYNLFEFDLAAEKLIEVDRALRIAEEILRYNIVKKKIKTAEEIEQEKKISDKIKEKTAKTEKEAKEKEEGKDKVQLKDLDKKLDKILETDDLL